MFEKVFFTLLHKIQLFFVDHSMMNYFYVSHNSVLTV